MATAVPGVESVRPVDGMRLLVAFADGQWRVYDCQHLLGRPRFRLLADPGFFHSVNVAVGGAGISWNGGIGLSEHELRTNGEPVSPGLLDATADGVHVVRVLSVGRLGDQPEEDPRASTPQQRLDQLERLRRQTAKAMGYAYPERLQRVLEVAEGP